MNEASRHTATSHCGISCRTITAQGSGMGWLPAPLCDEIQCQQITTIPGQLTKWQAKLAAHCLMQEVPSRFLPGARCSETLVFLLT